MLLRIEVFPQTGKGGSTDSENLKPSQTLYASPATVANRLKLLNGSNGDRSFANDNDNHNRHEIDIDARNNDHGPNAGLIATIGRKGDVDIMFGGDRSISRQHALLRFVAPRCDGTNKRARRSSRRGKIIDDDSNSGNERTATTFSGWFTEPRNADERSACDESPYGMCVVLESKGKSGSYIASKDDDVENDEKLDPKKIDVANDSDATTDDEGGGSLGRSIGSGNYETATSLSTQMGEVIISRKTLTPSQKMPSLSNSVRNHFGEKTPVKLTKIDSDENAVLKLDDAHVNDDDETDVTVNSSILIQFGVAQLPTIKITRIPMTVVFSSGVPSPIQNSLRICGGLLQEAGTLPNRGDNHTNRTTHLVANERMAVAKQLIAWCYGIPIVSPDFLLAMRNHSALKDPFPLSSDFPAKATDTSAFWKQNHDQTLLSRLTMISVDPSTEVEQSEGLAVAAGAKVERFYDKRKKHTKAGIQAFLKRAKGFLESTVKSTCLTQQQVFLLSSKTKSKYSNTNTTLLLKTLNEELLIPSITTKSLAKTISKQESMLVGLQSNKGTSSDSKNDRATDKILTEKVDKGRDCFQSPEWQLRKMDKLEHNSETKREFVEEDRNRRNQSSSGGGLFHDDIGSSEGGNDNSEMHSVEERSSHRSKIRKLGQHEEYKQVDFPETDDQAVLDARTAHDRQNSTTTNKPDKSIIENNQPTELSRADTNGWLKAAPRDDRERSRWRQRASDAYKTKTGFALEPSASTPNDPIIQVDIKTRATIHPSSDHGRLHANSASRHNNSNLPNFKKFRKNLIPWADPSEELVVLLDVGPPQVSTAPLELSAEERALREDQRIAEALFKGVPVPGMGSKKRRVRS